MIALSAPASPRRWRIALFAVVGTLVALAFLLMFGGVETLGEPWGIVLHAPEPDYTQSLHSWHQGQWAAQIGLLLGASLVLSLWRPRTRPLLMQFFLAGVLIHIVVNVAVAQSGIEAWPWYVYLIELAPPLLMLAVYPAPRLLLDLRPNDRASRPLLLLSGLALLALLPSSIEAWSIHAATTGEHIEHHCWAAAVALAALLVLGGLLAATKRPGFVILGVQVGVALIYLGFAALATVGAPGSWGLGGGLLSIAGGAAFIGATLWERRNAVH
jgi:hypothetical protein